MTIKVSPSASLASKKRKEAAVAAPTPPPPAQPRPYRSRSQPSTSAVAASAPSFSIRLNELQTALATSADLNPLSELIAITKEQSHSLSSAALIPALSLILRTFTHLLKHGSLKPWPVSRATGWLIVEAQPSQEEIVHNWLKMRFNEAVCLLANLALTHPKEKTRFASLKALVELQRIVTERKTPVTWSDCPWRAIIEAVIGGRCAAHPAQPVVVPQGTVGLAETRALFVQEWVEKHLDLKLAFMRSLKALVPGKISRADALTMLLPLSNPPTTKSAIESNGFLVDALSAAPIAAGDVIVGHKKAERRKNKRIFPQNGESEEDDADQGDISDEEEEDRNWFSDSDEEGQKQDEQTQPSKLAPVASSSRLKGGSSLRKRRRGGVTTLPFHEALHSTKAWKGIHEAAWLGVVLGGSPKAVSTALAAASKHEVPESGLSLAEINAVLRVMEKRILPFLSRPQLVADWLMDCLDIGGSTALLSLQPLFILYTSASLSLPTLYTTLYTLLTPALLHSPHRSYSLRLIYLFLCSEKLSLSIVAAFIKRLARCALRGPPGGIIPVVVLTYNLLKRHKEAMVLLHRENSESKTFVDPYESSLTVPPGFTHALESCLWEFVSLGAQPTNPTEAALQQRELESHYHAPTSTIVRMLAQPFTKESYDLEEFLDHSYSTLLANEFKRLLDEQGLAGQQPKSNRAHNAPPPAVRFSLPGSVHVLAKDGVTRKVKPPKVFPSGPAPAAVDVTAEDVGDEGTDEADETDSPNRPGLDPNEPGLDEEEREAREAMLAVEIENLRKEREERKAKKRRTLRQQAHDPMALWCFQGSR